MAVQFNTTAKRGTPRAAVKDSRVESVVNALNDKQSIQFEFVKVRAVSTTAAALLLPVEFKHGDSTYRIEIPCYIGKRGSRDSNALISAFAFATVNGERDANAAFQFLNGLLESTGERTIDKAACAAYDVTASSWYLSLSLRERDTVVSRVRGIINAGDIVRALKRHDAVINSEPSKRSRSVAEAAIVPDLDIDI